MVISQLTSSGGITWALTDEDALWMARAIVGESVRDASDVASCMIRRLAYVSDKSGRPVWSSLTELLIGTPTTRGYSQPVSYYWRDKGTEAQRARRLRIRSLTWAEIPAHVRQTVLDIFTGRAPLTVPGAIHFAVAELAQRMIANTPGAVLVPARANWFVAFRDSLPSRYRDPRLQPTEEGLALAHGRESSSLIVPIVLVALAAIAVAVML